MGRQVNYNGLVIAGIGFFLTRLTVTLALTQDPLQFYLGGVVPLGLGLGLAVVGVALTVADVEAWYVRTTARWTVFGAGTMLVLVLLTLLGSTPGGIPDLETVRSQSYLSNFLIGGSVGGMLTGLYAANNRRQRDRNRQQANRLVVLNRMLRHEVLNAVNAIQGYATVDDDGSDAGDIIQEQARAIQQTVEEIKYLTRSTDDPTSAQAEINLRATIDAAVATIQDRHPEATVTIDSCPPDLQVLASRQLERVIAHLLENAIRHGDDEAPVVDVRTTPTSARINVSDAGPGLPDRQRRLLEAGEIDAFDDPGAGFGLNVVRLFVEDLGGTIDTAVDSSGSTITVGLPRARPSARQRRPIPTDSASVRPTLPHLTVTFAASIIAAVFYGIVSIWLGGSVAGIGVFYGAANPVVGWLTHIFHSIVFGFVFAGLVSVAPERYRGKLSAHVGIGIAWAIVLWVVAAGLVAPIWLRLLGIPAPIPNLTGQLLVSHLAWGMSLGGLTAWGYVHVVPWLGDRTIRLPWSASKRKTG